MYHVGFHDDVIGNHANTISLNAAKYYATLNFIERKVPYRFVVAQTKLYSLVKKTLEENTIYQILIGLTIVLQNYFLPANRMQLFRT